MPSEAARAKVNLFLHVLGRRTDGYHLLDSLAVFAGAADVLHAEPADELSLAVEGPFGAGLEGAGLEEGNLVLRAARALRDAAGASNGARLVLDKRLPVASGIGGGSADAAAALRLLNGMWGLGLPPAALAGIALGLGADVPVCLVGEPARMGGIGELLGVAPILPPCGMALVNPGVAVSTASVFGARDGGYSEPASLPARWPDAVAMARDLAEARNDLEVPAMRLSPAVGEALAWLRDDSGCLLARMSGSGATCYGLFARAEQARSMAERAPPGWWAWGGSVA